MTHAVRHRRIVRSRVASIRGLILFAAVAASVAIASVVNAIEDVALDIERIEGDGWSAEGITTSLLLPGSAVPARMSIARLHVATLSQEFRNIRIECPEVELSADTIACRHARIMAQWPGVGDQSMRARMIYGRRDGSLDIAVDDIRLAEGKAAFHGTLSDGGWVTEIELQRVPVDLLVKTARALKAPIPRLTGGGLVSISAKARGSQPMLQHVSVNATLTDLTANNESGSLATDTLSLALRADVRRSADGLKYSMELRSEQGQAYVQPIFLDLGAHALSLTANGTLREGGELIFDRFAVSHAGVAQAGGSAVLDLAQDRPLRKLTLDLASLEFPGAYASYLQPLLLDTNFKSMNTAGRIAGQLQIENGAPASIDLQFENVTLDDGAGSFALTALHGQWHWRRESDLSDADAASQTQPPAPESSLHWRDGALYGLSLGASDLRFVTTGRQFRLLQAAHVPLLDGAIDLESFQVRNAGTPKVAFMVDATIRPISVQRLCQAFGWPEFGGQVAGVISKLRMREGVVTLGTTLHAQVFDGEVTIKDLRLEQPFGQWPRFYSNIALDNLDLELVTGAFSFGRITGRLSGAIDGLQLFNWTPVAFDARLYTPAGDRSKHRISQRAVENIGSIGGGGAGVTAALSSGFLRFFDDFNYDRLGLSCRLDNEVCYMNGVAPAPNGGYYLVKGRGLPRIDVIGSARRVDWPRLVQQLVAVTRSEGPVVE